MSVDEFYYDLGSTPTCVEWAARSASIEAEQLCFVIALDTAMEREGCPR